MLGDSLPAEKPKHIQETMNESMEILRGLKMTAEKSKKCIGCIMKAELLKKALVESEAKIKKLEEDLEIKRKGKDTMLEIIKEKDKEIDHYKKECVRHGKEQYFFGVEMERKRNQEEISRLKAENEKIKTDVGKDGMRKEWMREHENIVIQQALSDFKRELWEKIKIAEEGHDLTVSSEFPEDVWLSKKKVLELLEEKE